MSKLVKVELTFTREIGPLYGGKGSDQKVTIRADLSAEDGWAQWGAPNEILGDNVDVLQAVQDALSEHWGG